MKAVNLLLNSYLPEDLRNYDRKWDVKDLNRVMYAVAQKYPDRFADILQKVSDTGRKATYYQGETITLADMEPVIDKAVYLQQMEDEIAALPRDDDFIKNRRAIFQKYNELIEKEAMRAGLAKRNNVAMSVLSGARGKNAQFKAMNATPGTFSDYKGEPIDVFSRESFAEGINPTTFAASVHGTRASVVSTKCLEQNTLVRMGDMSARRICDIAPGDYVLGANKDGTTFPVKVLHIFDQGLRDCYRYHYLAQGKDIYTDNTENHKFLMVSSTGGTKISQAGKMIKGSRCWLALNDFVCASFKNKEHLGLRHCYDIEVDCPDHLFVLANDLITSNSSTAKGGDLAKQLAQSAADMVVRKENCGTDNGIVLDINDPSVRGRMLPRDFQGYKAGTFITQSMVNEWKKKGVEDVEVRSPLTCKVHDGLCADCVGKFFNGGKLPKVGEHVGVMSSTAVSEPVCLVKGTLVRMVDGTVKPIEDVEPGAYVFGVDLQGNCSKTRVVNKFHNGMRECYKTTFRKGSSTKYELVELCSTKEHKVLIAGAGGNKIEPIGLYVPGGSRVCQFGAGYSSTESQCVCTIKDSERCASDVFHAAHCAWNWDDSSVKQFFKDIHRTSKNKKIIYKCKDENVLQSLQSLLEVRAGIYPVVIKAKKNNLYKLELITPDDIRKFQDFINDKDSAAKAQTAFPVIKQEPLGMQDTWDLEVDNETHLFLLANGLVVSNTQMALCLHEYTEVLMGDGSSKLIKDIVPGDIVMAADKDRHTFPEKVLNVFDQGLQRCDTYSIQQGHKTVSVTCTKDHKFLYSDGTVAPCNIQKQFAFATQGANGVVSQIVPRDEVHCYDIEIGHPDHLFVLANGLITSNSAKHTAGMTQSKKTYSGLGALTQFVQSPEKYKDRGAVAELDGIVTKIEDAPQGGKFVYVGEERHYVPTGHEVEVQAGDAVEAGDQLSEGLVDAEDIVRLKGLGAGRRYYAERLNKMLKDSGAESDSRNTEILARAAIRHIHITGEENTGGYLPDDIADYNAFQENYKMPESTVKAKPSLAIGKYLQSPVLHYSIGTRITPKVAADMEKHGRKEIDVDTAEPSFQPEMVRLRTASHTNQDWLASMGTSYLTQQLNESATRGDDTNVLENTDWRPRLAYGKGFGENIETTGKF